MRRCSECGSPLSRLAAVASEYRERTSSVRWQAYDFLCDKPALKSGLFDCVVVSTDDAEIAEISKSLGADVPFARPADLSDDHTPTVPVIAHAIRQCQMIGLDPAAVCCIYPGVPFIRASDLAEAFQLLLKRDGDLQAFFGPRVIG